MVSKASDDLPEPLGPVKTTILPRGRLTLTFFRLCCRAPTTTSLSTVVETVSTERGQNLPARPDSPTNQAAEASAAERSRQRSSVLSMPTLRRKRPSEMLAAARASGGMVECVVDAG